jgi:hypothetical protein
MKLTEYLNLPLHEQNARNFSRLSKEDQHQVANRTSNKSTPLVKIINTKFNPKDLEDEQLGDTQDIRL